LRIAAQIERRRLRSERMLVELALHNRLDATGQASPGRVLLRTRDRAHVPDRKPFPLERLELVPPGQIVLVADAVQQHDLPLLAAIAERIEHAHERRQSRAGSDEQGGAAIVLQQEAALGALDVDWVAHLALPQQVGARAALAAAE